MKYVGLKEFDKVINPFINEGTKRRLRGLDIPPIAVKMSDDNSHLTLLRYYADKLKKNDRVVFSNLDEFVKINCKNGSLFDINEMLYDVKSVGIYQNPSEFIPVVIGVDFTNYDEEDYLDNLNYMVSEIAKIKCPFVFFVSNENSQIYKVLTEHIPSLRYVELNSYSTSELIEIGIEYARKYNVEFSEDAAVLLHKMIKNSQVNNSKLVCNLIREIIINAPDKDLIVANDIMKLKGI